MEYLLEATAPFYVVSYEGFLENKQRMTKDIYGFLQYPNSYRAAKKISPERNKVIERIMKR